MSTVREISVRLKAQTTDFTRELSKASKSLDDLARKSGDQSGAADTAMGRLVQSARLQSQAWATAGGALTGAGAAVTGLNVAVAKTGVEYNMLQQKSRAALDTILGGTHAANEQMDQLDEFAKTSPFAKDVFIKAQQQMLGFGIETKKVIPYLSALNEVVAATGGSNNDIAELSLIISQIQANAKITAVDLMQFAQRGVDAATLIGSQMDMTGAQVRESITKGTLDAGEALDALAAGMQERFGGASANVKDTLVGAFDRVKAAWRDLSSSLMEGAVGTSGGGWLVDMTNGFADLLRVIEKMPQPAKDVAFGLSSIAGVSLLGAGGVLMAVPKFVELHTAFKDLADISPRAASGLGKVGKAAGVAAAAFSAALILSEVADSFKKPIVEGDALQKSLEGVASKTIDVNNAFKSLDGTAIRGGGFSFTQGMVGDLDNLENVTKAFLSRVEYGNQQTGKLFGVISTGATDAIQHFHTLDSQLKSLPIDQQVAAVEQFAEGMRDAGAQSRDVADAFPQMFEATRSQILSAGEEWEEYGNNVDVVVDAMTGKLPDGLVMTAEGIMSVAQAQEAAAEGFEAVIPAFDSWTAAARMGANASEDAAKAYAELVGEIAGGYSAFIDLSAAFDEATAKQEEFGWSAERTTEQWLAELDKQAEAQQKFRTNLIELAGQIPEGMLQELAAKGPEVAGQLQMMVDMKPEQRAKVVAAWEAGGAEASGAFADSFVDVPAVLAALGQVAGEKAVSKAKSELASGKTSVEAIVREYNLEMQIKANTDPAIASARAALDRISRMSTSVQVGAYHKAGFAAPQAAGGPAGFANWVPVDVATQFRRAAPGRLSGPGTGTSDSIPILASNGEWIVRERAARDAGTAFMSDLNAGRLTHLIRAWGYASGGEIGRRPEYRPRLEPYVPAKAAGGARGGGLTYAPVNHIHGNDAHEVAALAASYQRHDLDDMARRVRA